MLRQNMFMFFWMLLIGSVAIGHAQDLVVHGDTLFYEDSTSAMAHDAKHFLQAGIGIFTAPLHFSATDWRKTILSAAVTAALFTLDRSAKSFALSHHNRFNDNLFNFDAYHGDKYTFDFSLALYGVGYLLGKDRIRLMGLHSLEAFLYAGAITHVLKTTFGRRRPYGGENHLIFKPFRSRNLYSALPSGHATGAFAVSTVMAKSVNNTLWKGAWYGAAAMVAASRVYHNAHWLSDVFLGGVIGYSVASYVVRFEQRPQANSATFRTIRITPDFSMGGLGLAVIF